jgi:hypothetical protein
MDEVQVQQLVEANAALASELATLRKVMSSSEQSAELDLSQQNVEQRTAERLYCVRLGMLSQLNPMGHPGREQLHDLALHCWEAARILTSCADPEHYSQEVANAMMRRNEMERGLAVNLSPNPLMPDPKDGDF